MQSPNAPHVFRFAQIVGMALAVFATPLGFSSNGRAQSETVLYDFAGGSDGIEPLSVIFGPDGHLYGTNESTAFELSPVSGVWTLNTLYNFTGTGFGGVWVQGLIFDAAGTLYGVTAGGNNGCFQQGCGMVFELSPVSGGWIEKTLYSFTGKGDGAAPWTNLTLDKAGNIYGTTTLGGNLACIGPGGLGCGVVFKLTPVSDGWQETVLYTFTGRKDGGVPYGGVIFDATGNLYGAASSGGDLNCRKGNNGCGVVFKLSPTASGSWKETIIHTFSGRNDGSVPTNGIISDSAGNLYGAASQGGPDNGGTVFKLVPDSAGGWNWSTLHNFNVLEGNLPASLSLDSAGNLYGTTVRGGDLQLVCAPLGCGTVFELSPASGGGWNEKVLHIFAGGSDGNHPTGNLALDGTGHLYGTAEGGGTGGGLVFEITP
jgi:uncharacterized repeat protein (TIGR03803 family)